MTVAAFLALLFFLLTVIPGFSLHEDQVGLVDWHRQFIGKVNEAVFPSQKTGRKRVIVCTDENVIASLDLRHGDIFWRRVLGTNETINGIDMAMGKYAITLSSNGSILRAWNLPDGQMEWESFLHGLGDSRSFLVSTSSNVDKDAAIFVFGKRCLFAVSSAHGGIIWKMEFPTESFEVQEVIHPQRSDFIFVVGYNGMSHFMVYQVNAKNGELVKHATAAHSEGVSGEVSQVSSNTVLVLDSKALSVLIVSFWNGNVNLQKTYISNMTSDSMEMPVIIPSKIEGMFALKSNKSVFFIKVDGEGKLVVVDMMDHVVAISDPLTIAEDQQAFAVVQCDGDMIYLTVKLCHDWNRELVKESIKVESQRGSPQKVFINSYIRTDRSHGFRALIVMEDHSLVLIQQGEVVWSREDGLASIIDVAASELPVEKKGVSVAKVEQSLLDWLQGHMLKLKGTLMLASPEDMAAIQQMRMKVSEKNKMTRDHNGFRKLLVVLTKAGKVYALHTGDGRIVWSLWLNSPHISDSYDSPRWLNLFAWQVPHHHALDENPSVLVVGKQRQASDARGILSFVDTYTGKMTSFLGLDHTVLHVIPLPFTDSYEQRLHLLVDDGHRAHLYPKTAHSLSIFHHQISNMYWYSVDAETGTIKGYALKKRQSAGEVGDQYHFESRDVWSIVFPSESEKIIEVVAKKLNEVVHTQAKVIADQEVMYKYSSKNLLFVATVAPKGSVEIGSVVPEDSWLVVYLIEVVTGRILHRMTHHGSQGPVHAVFSENWVVYHYFNIRAHRYEMSVIEIYDQSLAESKGVWKLVVGKHNLTAPLSSYSRPDVAAKPQSYFFTHSVKAMTFTSTAKGITSKQLLVGTVLDQVLAIDKRLLDPRRSANPTQSEKEEGLLPLTDSLPIIPQAYVTHGVQVEGLRRIVTVPAKLESTTLVFVYGVDLFFTQFAPSRTYDSLTDDFNYALLLATIAALLAALHVTWVLAGKKELQEQWR